MSLDNYRIASNPKINVWVSASAGSGKTKSLTDRFLRLLLDGVDPEKILCLTFTKVAAAEMLNRIKNTLGEWHLLKNQDLKEELTKLTGKPVEQSIHNTAKTLLHKFINRQDKLQIQTIHSFCQKILMRFPIEAGIKMNPTLITDQQKSIFIEKAKNQFLKNYESELSDPSFLSYLLENIHENTLDSLIDRVVYIDSMTDFINNKENYTNKLCETLNFDIGTYEKDKEKLFSTLKNTINQHHLALSNINAENNIPIISECLKFGHNTNIESLKSVFLTKEGSPRSTLLNKKIATSNPEILAVLEKIQNIVQKYNDLEISEKTFKLTQGFLDLVYLFSKHFSEIKNHAGCIDYNDLINITLNLLQNESLKDWIESKLNQKISHVMVDESQDVNLRQWQIIHTCLKDFFSIKEESPNTIFVVGDQKQSIYSFQGSSPELFSGMKTFISDTAESFESKISEINFTHSFRSDPLILNFVDDVFSTINEKNDKYFCEENLKHISSKKFPHSSIEIWPLVLDKERPASDKNSYEWKITDSYENNYNPSRVLAKMIAEKISSSITTGTFTPSDFMVLVRKRDSLCNYIVEELKHLNIPVSGIDRLILNDNIAIKDLLSLIQFILLPDDDYNLACLLKSPIFLISEEQLFQISQREEKTIWKNINALSPKHDYLRPIQTTLEYLLNSKEIHSPYTLITTLLEAKGYRKKFLSRLGMHISEVLDEFINICLEFEQSGDKSLLSFLNWFNNSRIEIKKEIGTNTEEVKVMTIHGAKGLQAKFVILPDTVTIPKNKNSVLFDQLNDIILYNVPENKNSEYRKIVEGLKLQNLQEYYRLLYVGLTRASEHLLICGHSSSTVPELSWYNVINKAVSNTGDKLYYTEQGSAPKHENFCAQQSTESDMPSFLLEPHINDKVYYTASPAEKLLKKTESTEHAINVGKLTHRILEYFIPLRRKINESETKKFVEIYKETSALPFTTKQLKNICDLANNYILPLTENAELETELKIKKSYRLNDKSYEVSGVIDLLVLKKEEIHIIDYKTDKIIPETSAEIDIKYLKQMAMYKEMVENIYPGRKIICHLAWTHKPMLLEIKSANLEAKDLELI